MVLVDACVLFSASLRDLLMHLAIDGLIRPRWTNEIHNEWVEAVLKSRTDLSRQKLHRTRDLMNSHVVDALITGYESLIPTLSLPDPDDRHVLAAAIHAGATDLLTFNLSDFPPDILARHGVDVWHPDDFLLRLFQIHLSVLDAA